MKISRQVGTQSQILNVYVQDFNVTTGAGLANIPATTVSYSWFRNNQSGVSTGVSVSTASMGAYTSGAWTQINSATALGWYQFGIPNDALLSGDCCALHLYVSTGAFTMAPLPIEIELTKTNNQQYMSSQTVGFVLNGVNMTSVRGTAAVTSAGGQLLVSTQTLASVPTAAANALAVWSEINSSYSGVSTFGYLAKQVTSIAAGVNVTSIRNSPAVTSGAGILNVSTQTLQAVAAADVWNAFTSTYSSAGTFGGGFLTSSDVASSSQIIQGIWGELTTAYTSAASTMGLAVYTAQSASGLTSSVVGDAVWSRINSSYSGISTFGYVLKQVTSIAAGVNVTGFAGAITTNARVVQIYGSAAATSGAGIFTVSTQTLSGATGSVNVSSIMGSPVVTTAAGVILVSTQSLAGIVVSTQTIPSFAVAGDAMALTAGERATLAGTILTTTQAESYRSVNATGSLMQLMYEVVGNLTEQTASGTTRTLASVTSHTGNVAQYQYDSSSNPASITRIS
jgi:hypothetical protein